MALYGYLGGDKNKKIKHSDFLPFNLGLDDQDKISKSTAKIFVELLDDEILPSKVISACGRYLDQIKKLEG